MKRIYRYVFHFVWEKYRFSWNEMSLQNIRKTEGLFHHKRTYNVFYDCYRNIGHFLCSVESISVFWTSICIASSAMFPLRWANTQHHQNCCAVKSHSRVLATFQSNGNSTENKELFEWNVCFVRILIRLYIQYGIHKVCNSLKTPLTQP